MRHASCHHAITSRDEDHPYLEEVRVPVPRNGKVVATTGLTRHHVPYEKRLKEKKCRAQFRETRARGDMHKSTSKDL